MINNYYYNKYLKYKIKYNQLGGFNFGEIKTEYMNIKNFVKIMTNNKYKQKDQFEEILNDHRKGINATILNIIDEYFESKKHNPNSKTNIIYLIYDNKIIAIGRIIYHSEGYINMINIAKNLRGNKICNFLIEEIVNLTKKYHNINKFLLHVKKDNIPAIKCYEHNGFKISGSDDEFYEYIMNLEI